MPFVLWWTLLHSKLPPCGQTEQSCLMHPWNILFGFNLVITHMCTANAQHDRFGPRVCGLWAFSKHLSGCHQMVFYLPIVSPHFSSPLSRVRRESEREGASRRMLEGFVFLNHSQSVIQSVHTAVSLLPLPLSSCPAIWDPSPSASTTSTTAVCQGKQLELKCATGGSSNDGRPLLWSFAS